jgi:small subunit ribosomal protein S6
VNVSTPAASARSQVISRAREYETIYILRSDVDAEGAERVQARVADAIDRELGKLVKVEAWGRRKLAYPVGKQRKGVYVYVKYVGGGSMVAEVERNLKLQDVVMKFMTVQSSPAVDLAALQIDPEEIKLGKLELPAEPEPEESREKQLGLIDLGPEAPHRRPIDEVEDFGEPPEEAADEAAPEKAKTEGGEEG